MKRIFVTLFYLLFAFNVLAQYEDFPDYDYYDSFQDGNYNADVDWINQLVSIT